MNETISKIKALLIDASERQHESSFKVKIITDILDRLKADVKAWSTERKDIETEMSAPRNEAKELALQYVLDGMDSNLLPRAMNVRYRKSYSYDEKELIGWLISEGHEDILKIDTKKLNAMLKERGTKDCPATEVEAAEIVCDTDLKWMTEDD